MSVPMPTIETYRKQAKQLLRWHREGDYSLGGRVRRLERYQSLTDHEVLALKFTLAVAQEIVAVEAGHQSWAELKAATAGAPKTPRTSSGQQFLKSVRPILLVRDVKACATFFQQKLGFEIDFLHVTARYRETGFVCTSATCSNPSLHKPRFTRSR